MISELAWSSILRLASGAARMLARQSLSQFSSIKKTQVGTLDHLLRWPDGCLTSTTWTDVVLTRTILKCMSNDDAGGFVELS